MPGLNNAPVSIDLAGAEIVAWVPGAEVAAVCGGDDTIRFVAYDAAFKNPEVVLEAVFEGSIQSVTAHGSYVAVAESLSKTETGLVRVYRYTPENTLEAVFSQEVGYLPDSGLGVRMVRPSWWPMKGSRMTTTAPARALTPRARFRSFAWIPIREQP